MAKQFKVDEDVSQMALQEAHQEIMRLRSLVKNDKKEEENDDDLSPSELVQKKGGVQHRPAKMPEGTGPEHDKGLHKKA